MTKGSVSLLVGLVFLAGVVSGFFFGARVQKESGSGKGVIGRAEASEAEAQPESTEDRIMRWLVRYLELEPGQEEAIRPLLRLAIQEHEELEREFDSRVDTFIENSDRRIAEHLTEEQARKLVEHNRKKRLKRDAVLSEQDLREATLPRR